MSSVRKIDSIYALTCLIIHAYKLLLFTRSGLYIIEFPPGKSKGLEMGKGKEGGKKRKKENLGKIYLLAVPNHKT